MKTTALIIDDEIQIRRLLRVALESAGYTLHEAETGQQGLSEVAMRRPDVILLDPAAPVLIRTEPGIGYRFMQWP